MFCARTYYCITDGMPFKEWYSFTSIRQGGLSILGGIMGGVIAGLIVCLVKKINFLKVADCVVINILIAQAIGRWGILTVRCMGRKLLTALCNGFLLQ